MRSARPHIAGRRRTHTKGLPAFSILISCPAKKEGEVRPIEEFGNIDTANDTCQYSD